MTVLSRTQRSLPANARVDHVTPFFPSCWRWFFLLSRNRASAMSLEAIRYRRGSLQILNQLVLPQQSLYEEIGSVRQGWEAIRAMKVLRSGMDGKRNSSRGQLRFGGSREMQG